MLSSAELQMFKHYEVGDELIDNEHMRMFELISIGRAATHTAELTLIMRELLDLWNMHKEHEADLMRKIKFPYVESHIEQHKILTNEFHRKFGVLVTRNDTIVSKYLNPMRDILDKLLEHIDHYDIGLREYINKTSVE